MDIIDDEIWQGISHDEMERLGLTFHELSELESSQTVLEQQQAPANSPAANQA